MNATRLSVTLLLLFLGPTASKACTCAMPPPGQETSFVQQQLKTSDIVFRGELIEHRNGAAIFRIIEKWKGKLGSTVEIEWRRGDRGDCNGFRPDDLKVGNELVVFASRSRFGIYRTSICRPTTQTSAAQNVLSILGPGAAVAQRKDKSDK